MGLGSSLVGVLMWGAVALAATDTHTSKRDCEARLRSPVARLTAKAVASRQLTREEVQHMADSPIPLDPLAHFTRSSSNSSLKNAMAKNIARTNPAEWREIQIELRAWLAEEKKEAATEAKAVTATETLLVPHAIASIKKSDMSNRGFTVFTDARGHTMALTLSKEREENAKILLADLTTNTAPITIDLGYLYSAEHKTRVLKDGRVEIAVLAEANRGKVITFPDLENSRTFELPGIAPKNEPQIPDASPSDFVTTPDGHTYIVFTNHQNFHVFDLANSRTPVFSVNFSYAISRPLVKLFASSKNELFMSFTDNEKIVWAYCAKGRTTGQILSVQSSDSTNHAQWWETDEGDILLSNSHEGGYCVYSPLKSQEPVYTADVGKYTKDNFWFRDYRGHDINVIAASDYKAGVEQPAVVRSFDFTDKKKIFEFSTAKIRRVSPAFDTDSGPHMLLTGEGDLANKVWVINPADQNWAPLEITLSLAADFNGYQTILPFTLRDGSRGFSLSGPRNGLILMNQTKETNKP